MTNYCKPMRSKDLCLFVYFFLACPRKTDAVTAYTSWVPQLGPDRESAQAGYTRGHEVHCRSLFSSRRWPRPGCGGDDPVAAMANLIPTSPTPDVPFSVTDLREGTGAEAVRGRGATVRYTGWLYSPTSVDNKGTQFDSGQFSFTVGQGVIEGFSVALEGMLVGGLRRVVIPPRFAYGANPPPGIIRPNETLLFEIELLAVQQ